MGEAKRRGTLDERVKARRSCMDSFSADQQSDDLSTVTHLAVIMDHSEEGRATVDMTMQAFPELSHSIAKFSDSYAYMVFVRGKSGKDQGTLLVPDLETLMTAGINEVLKKVASVGGRCGFILAVDPTYVDRLSKAVNGQVVH